MQCAGGAVAVPDFLSCDLFADLPGCGHDPWSCSIVDDFGSDVWTVDCFGTGDASQAGSYLTPDPFGLVKNAASLFPDYGRVPDEASVVSEPTTATTTPLYGGAGQLLADDCASSLAVAAKFELLEPVEGSIVTCSCSTDPKLTLDYGNVLSEWEKMGGNMALDAGVAAQDSVTLCLPPPSASDSKLAALPAYNLDDPSCSLALPPSGLCSVKAPRDSLPGCRVASLQSTAGGGGGLSERRQPIQSADDIFLCSRLLGSGSDSDCASDDSFAGALCSSALGEYSASSSSRMAAALMPAVPSAYGSVGSLATLCMSSSLLPQSLASIPAKATECTKSARAACFVRYKEKKQNRQIGRIRYEMRKINADKRPRIKGRFVKREELSMLLAEAAMSSSPHSGVSSMSESSWA